MVFLDFNLLKLIFFVFPQNLVYFFCHTVFIKESGFLFFNVFNDGAVINFISYVSGSVGVVLIGNLQFLGALNRLVGLVFIQFLNVKDLIIQVIYFLFIEVLIYEF